MDRSDNDRFTNTFNNMKPLLQPGFNKCILKPNKKLDAYLASRTIPTLVQNIGVSVLAEWHKAGVSVDFATEHIEDTVMQNIRIIN